MTLIARRVTVSMLLLLSFACTKATKESNRANSSGGDGLTDGTGGEGDPASDGTGADGGTDDLVGDDAVDGDDEVGGDTGTLDLNVLAVAYPEGLTVALLPEAVPAAVPASIPLASTGTLSVQTSAGLLLDDPAPPKYDPLKSTFADKIVAVNMRLSGEGDCFDPDLLNPPAGMPPACYDPDLDLNFKKPPQPQTVPPTPPTIENRPTAPGGEACMATYARQKMSDTIAVVDRATGFLVAMLCQSKKSGLIKDVPTIGDNLDLKAELTTALAGAGGLEVQEANVERLNNTDGHMRFFTQLKIGYTNGANVRQETIKLLHAPDLENGNKQFHGRLWIASGASHLPKVQFLQINYQRDGAETAPSLKFELVKGVYAKADPNLYDQNVAAFGNPFDPNGVLDLNYGANFNPLPNPLYSQWPGDLDSNDTMTGSTYIAFAMNPLTSVGKLMYWQNFGGSYNETARGTIINLVEDEDEDHRLKGCSVSGAAGNTNSTTSWSIRKAQKTGEFDELIPIGYYHPGGYSDTIGREASDCPIGLCQRWPYVYKQCFVQNSLGKYEIEDSGVDGFKILPGSDPQITAVLPPDVSMISDISR